MAKILRLAIFAAVIAAAAQPAQASILGPVFPAPGGTMFSGSGTAGNAGGRTLSYSGLDDSQFSALYWGVSHLSPVLASLNGAPSPLTFSFLSGNTANWIGSGNYQNPTTGSVHFANFWMRLEVSGLGPSPWMPASSVAGLNPAAAAVVDNSAGLDFSANVQFLGNIGSGWLPLNSFPQPSSPFPLTLASVNFGFYYSEVAAIPEPETYALLLAGLGLLGFAARRRKI